MDVSRKRISLHVLLAIPLLVGALAHAARPQDKNPLIGTWNANIEKSKRHPNHLYKSAKLQFSATNGVITLSYTGVNMSGVEETGNTVFHHDGKEHPLEVMAGAVEVSRWVNPQKLETVVTQNGKVIGHSTYEVSADGRTLTAVLKGTDASGAPFEQIIVCDRE